MPPFFAPPSRDARPPTDRAAERGQRATDRNCNADRPRRPPHPTSPTASAGDISKPTSSPTPRSTKTASQKSKRKNLPTNERQHLTRPRQVPALLAVAWLPESPEGTGTSDVAAAPLYHCSPRSSTPRKLYCHCAPHILAATRQPRGRRPRIDRPLKSQVEPEALTRCGFARSALTPAVCNV